MHRARHPAAPRAEYGAFHPLEHETMDLLNALTSIAGIDTPDAQALAGAVLGAARSQADDAGTEQLDAAVPELDAWVDAAQHRSDVPDEAPREGFLGNLMDFAGSSTGGALLGAVAGEEAKEKAQVVAVLSKVGLSAGQAAPAAPILLSFLEERMGKDSLGKLLAAAPILQGLAQLKAGGEGNDLASTATGLLSGLFGR